MPGLLVFCLWFIAGHVFRHLSEKAPADSTHLWIATKSETDRLPRRAGFAVILHGAEFVIFSICPRSDIGTRSVRRDGRNFDCDGFGTGLGCNRRRVWCRVWRLWRWFTGAVGFVTDTAVARAELDGEWSLSLASSDSSEFKPSGGMSRMTGKEGGLENTVVVTVDRSFFLGRDESPL